jgi:hypothetical protein
MQLQDSALSHDQMEAVLAAGIDLGQLHASIFFTTMGETACLASYENVKKSKAWKIFKNPNNPTGGKFESLDEFCRAKLGKSYNRLQALASNRNVIGQEAFEQAEKMGLRQVDYNAIKALPAPEQELIRRAVGTQSRDEVLDLLQELCARHAQEKVSTAKAHAAAMVESEAQLAAKQRALDASSATIANLHQQLGEEFEPSPGSIAKTQQEETLLEEINAITLECGEIMRRLFLAADTTFEAPVGDGVKDLARHSVEYLCQELAAISVEFGIKVNFEELVNPPWMSPDMLAAMQAKRDEAAAKDAAKAEAKASGKAKLKTV